MNKKLLELVLRELKKRKRPKGRPATWQPISMIPQEREYLRDLKRVLNDLFKSIDQNVIKRLDTIQTISLKEMPIVLKDSYSDDLKKALKKARVDFDSEWTDEKLTALAKRRGLTISSINKLATDRNWKRVTGIDLSLTEPWLESAMATYANMNASLITSIRDKLLGEVETIAQQGLINGTRWETIASDIQDRFSVSESKAALLARDQTNKLNGQLTEIRQRELGFTKYIWRTMGDDRVRESHREKEGNVYSWDDPPADTGHVGQDYNCRCYGEPYFVELFEE